MRWKILTAVIFLGCFLVPNIAADDLRIVRGDMKAILKSVSADVKKNFYDPELKGLNWDALTEEARQKIDKAGSVAEMYAAIYELVEKLDDSHTAFIPPASSETPEYGFEAKPYGNEIRIYDVEPNSAAAKAGLKVGDTIVQFQGYTAERDTYHRLSMYALAIYGVSPLELVVKHPDGTPEILKVTPKLVQTPKIIDRYSRYGDIWKFYTDWQTYAQKHYTYWTGLKDVPGANVNGKPAKVGYIDLRGFPGEGEDLLRGLAEEVGNAKAVVVDLRDNPGGAVNTLLSFAGLFETTDTEMGTWESRKKKEPMKIRVQKFKLNAPIVLLIDSTTASAAEMLARHLQRNKKALVVGDRSAGAVTGANSFDGEVGAKFVMWYSTYIGVARVRLSDGEVLEKVGVKPDVECIPASQDMAEKRDVCLNTALQLAHKSIVSQPALQPVAR